MVFLVFYNIESLNLGNININQVNITNVYKNVDVNNGVTVVHRNTFATASPRIVNVTQSAIQEKIFTRNNISIGTPDIKPTRASYFSSDRSVPAAKRPPQTVRNVQIMQLKQSRPFIKEADKSVLNPGIVPKILPVNTVTTPRTPGKGKPMIQQVQPEEKGKTVEPRGGPTGRGEKQQVKPAERVKPAAPEGGPTGRGEKQQVKPTERMNPAAPEGGPTGRGEKQQVKPAERVKPAAPEGGPTGRGEKQQVKPADRVKPTAPEGGREKKDKKETAEPDESPQKDKKKHGEGKPER